MRTPIAWVAVVVSLALVWPASGQEVSAMKIRLTFDSKAVEATLLDNATARDFVSLLPITMTLEDYNSTEKIGYPPRKLSKPALPKASIRPWRHRLLRAMRQPGDLLQGFRVFARAHPAGSDRLGDPGAEHPRLTGGHDRPCGEVRHMQEFSDESRLQRAVGA